MLADVSQGVIFTFLSSFLVIDFLLVLYIVIFQVFLLSSKFLTILYREMEFSLPMARLVYWICCFTILLGEITQLYQAFELVERHYIDRWNGLCDHTIQTFNMIFNAFSVI